jgi:hypothetical protein
MPANETKTHTILQIEETISTSRMIVWTLSTYPLTNSDTLNKILPQHSILIYHSFKLPV